MSIGHVLAVSSGKGGTLKTSVSSVTAGLTAAGGWRVLLVDLDEQGDCQTNLGYTDRTDAGASMAAAVESGGVPDVLAEVRPNLDVICGGPHLQRVASTLTSEALSGRFWQNRLELVIAPLAVNYDLVVLDLPPQFGVLHRAAYHLAHYLLVPSQVDRASLNGIAEVLTTLLEVRATTNPNLELLGVVCGPVLASATAQARDLRATIADILGTGELLIEPFIRSAPAAAELCRRDGLLPHELEDNIRTEEANNPFWKSLREGRKQPRRRTAAAGGLAGDYEQIVTEILRRFVQRQTELADSGTVDLREPAPSETPEGTR